MKNKRHFCPSIKILQRFRILKKYGTGTEVLKRAWDFVLIGYGKVTDANTAAFERRVYYLQFPRGTGMPCHAGPGQERISVGQEEGVRGNHQPERLLRFSQEEMGKAG